MFRCRLRRSVDVDVDDFWHRRTVAEEPHLGQAGLEGGHRDAVDAFRLHIELVGIGNADDVHVVALEVLDLSLVQGQDRVWMGANIRIGAGPWLYMWRDTQGPLGLSWRICRVFIWSFHVEFLRAFSSGVASGVFM